MLAAALLAAASPVSAARFYEAKLVGTLVAQTTTGASPTWNVGDTLTLTARFNSSHVIRTANGFAIAGFDGLDTTGDFFFRIDGEGQTWSAGSEISDGGDWVAYEDLYQQLADGSFVGFSKILATPGIVFKEGRISALDGTLIPPGDIPNLRIGGFPTYEKICSNESPGATVTCVVRNLPVGNSSGAFELTSFLAYGSTYSGPNFRGEWDFANSSVTLMGVPEPATWAMMILGFGAVGAAMRGRKRLAIA